MKADHFAEACPKFVESAALDPQIGTTLNLALCYEAVDRTASACAAWREAISSAALKDQADRHDWAQERAAQVCPRVPMVRVDVAPQPGRDAIAVTVGGEPVPRERWGVPIAMDPGQYTVVATAPGSKPWSASMTVDGRRSAAVIVPVLESVSAAETSSQEVKWTDAATPATAPVPATPPTRPLRTVAWITGGTGLALLGVGAAFGLAAIVNDNASNDGRNCVFDRCNGVGIGERWRAIHDAQTADVTLTAGAAATGAGIVLWLLAPGSETTPSVSVKPGIGTSAWSLTVRGGWL